MAIAKRLDTEPVRSYSKQQQLTRTRIRPTQRQMGEIIPKVRAEVRTRSGGVCEVLQRCNGARAMEQAHITGRRHLDHRTKAEDLLDSCVECHRWLDNTPEGIRYKRKLREGSK